MQRYTNSVQDTAGNALTAALIRVYLPGGVTAATIYSDNGTTTISQPLTVDSTGEFAFYAENGTYDIKISVSGVDEWLNSQLLYDPNDAATKKPCICATTANVDLTTGGLLTIDGVALVAGDRVLVKSQTAAAQNGVYIASAGAWTRASDADTSIRLAPGAVVPVISGTAKATTLWILTSAATPVVVGTTAITVTQI